MMRLRSSAIFNLACSLLVVSAAALAYGIASRPVAQQRALERVTFAAPAETVIARTPAERNDAATKLRVAADIDASDRALFIPRPTYPQVAVQAQAQPARTAAAPRPAAMHLASVASKPAAAPPRDRSADRPGAVLNDAQIASIKQRLNLTPDQERMWPSVEAALRGLAYAKNGHPHKGGTRDAAQAVAAIDPTGPDVQNLKSAAFPLIMSFNDDQMRELQSITRVAGLDKLVSNF